MTILELDQVTFAYNAKRGNVLKNVTMTCEDGSVNTIIGLNGCGKTTLIKCMAGLYNSRSGSVSYDGVNLSGISINDRSHLMSYVSQINRVIGDYRVIDYLCFGTANKLEFYESPGEKELSAVASFVKRFKIEHLCDKRLGELSGGERQIVSICSAMIQNTELVLLDEPMSALDMRNQQSVMSLLRDIAKEDGKTIVLSTHNPNHALYLDSRVFLMKNGEIVDRGSASECITVDRLRPIYGSAICNSRDLDYNEISFG